MKAVILAGGLGTRISEETHLKPKPMVEIGGHPIIWHIMKIYSSYGIDEFIICCGYKGYIIKEYFANYFLHTSDVTLDLKKNETIIHHQKTEPWKVTLVDTGQETMTGGRLLRVKEHLQDDETFCFTYGDGLSNVDINELIKYHQSHKLSATLTAVIPPSRFGLLDIEGSQNCKIVRKFEEKPRDSNWINGGFFVLNKSVIDLIKNDSISWEFGPLTHLASVNQLAAFHHEGFWQPMDTLRDRNYLEELWNKKKAPWKVW